MSRKIIVHIAASADGYIARPDGDIDWLTNRPAPKGFYGIPKFMQSIDATIFGRKTFEIGLKLGGTFDGKKKSYVFSRQPPPPSLPPGVEFVNEPVASFVKRLRRKKGKHIWMMGGGEVIASFLEASAIDEFVVSIIPVFIGQGIPLIAPRYLHVPLQVLAVTHFPDGVVQVHYQVKRSVAKT